MPEHPVDVISQITADHRAVESLFTDYENGQGDATGTVGVLVRELSLHAGVEELLLYPVARNRLDNGDQVVDHSLEEHQKVKEVLTTLDGTSDGSAPDVRRNVEELKGLVEEHVQEEESEMLPGLERVLSEQERRDLGDLFLKAKEVAPTRPHPHAPNTPPMNAIADAVAALLDKARDTVSDMKK